LLRLSPLLAGTSAKLVVRQEKNGRDKEPEGSIFCRD
jgi:hypothetical protein